MHTSTTMLDIYTEDGALLTETDGEPIVYISEDTAKAKAMAMSTSTVKAQHRRYFKRGELIGYVIRLKVLVH